MTPADRDRAVKQLEDTIALIKTLPVVTPCATCYHFGGNQTCGRWNAPVPAEAQAAGCDQWADDIPF